MLKIAALRTCEEYRINGMTASDSGLFLIDPDGANNGLPPFEVFCDFATGTTVVHHNSENSIRIPKCNSEGCFQHNVNYGLAEFDQLRALIELSESCAQRIEVSSVCIYALL